MSNRICNRNIERDARLCLISELIEAGFASDITEYETRIEELMREVLLRTTSIASVCPLCHRVYHHGDAMCHCRPATTVSKRAPGQPRERGVKCEPRVVGLRNRHMLRKVSVKFLRDERRYQHLLKTLDIFKVKKSYKEPKLHTVQEESKC
jgi:hypothetical protein